MRRRARVAGARHGRALRSRARLGHAGAARSREPPPADAEAEADPAAGTGGADSAIPLRAYALVREGDATRVVDLEPGKEYALGRARECEIMIESARVSRRQAVL